MENPNLSHIQIFGFLSFFVIPMKNKNHKKTSKEVLRKKKVEHKPIINGQCFVFFGAHISRSPLFNMVNLKMTENGKWPPLSVCKIEFSIRFVLLHILLYEALVRLQSIAISTRFHKIEPYLTILGMTR